MLHVGAPAPPQALGRLPRQPRLGRRRRGPHLPRRLRLPRRQRAAPAAARRPHLRRRAALPARLGDDRQPGRAGRAAGRDSRSSCSTTTARPRAGREIAMWNPPRDRRGDRDPALAALARRPTCSPSWSRTGVRTICFLKSRRGIELIKRFACEKLSERRQGPSWPSGSPPTAPATRRSSGARSRRGSPSGELLAVVATDALELGDRRRRARRGDLRHLPGHRRQPAPDVGAGRAPPPRARRLRRRPGRARPVLLPPPGRVPRAAGRGGDPRPRYRADRRSQHLVAAAYELPLGPRRRRGLRRGLARARPSGWSTAGELRRRRAAAS